MDLRVYVFLLVWKESSCNAGDLGSIPGLGRSSGEGKGCPLQYSGLENSTDCIVYGLTKTWTWLSNFHFIHSYLGRELNFTPFECRLDLMNCLHSIRWGKENRNSIVYKPSRHHFNQVIQDMHHIDIVYLLIWCNEKRTSSPWYSFPPNQ